MIWKELCRENTGCGPDGLKLMQGRFLGCQLLESAFDAGEPVTVLGYGAINGNDVKAISVTVDKPAPEPADGNPAP